MKFIIQYEMDHVGYGKEYTADSKEKAIVLCVDELRKEYPESIVNIVSVEEVEKVKKKKE